MNYKSLQWLKEYREQNGEVYPEDPFAVVFHPEEDLYAFLHETADGSVDVWTYLVLGADRALVVDTGYGIGDFLSLIRRFAGERELITVITHHHPDHRGGLRQFARAFCHPYCVPYLEPAKDPAALDGYFDGTGCGIYLDCAREDVPPYKDFELCPCEDGTVWDLGGGLLVRMLWTPGHACGGASYLDSKGRLFAGDGIQCGSIGVAGNHRGQPHEEFNRVEALKLAMDRLAEFRAEISSVWPGHHSIPVPPEAIDQMRNACEEIMEDPGCYDYLSGNYVPGEVVRMKRMPFGGEIEFKETGIFIRDGVD